VVPAAVNGDGEEEEGEGEDIVDDIDASKGNNPVASHPVVIN